MRLQLIVFVLIVAQLAFLGVGDPPAVAQVNIVETEGEPPSEEGRRRSVGPAGQKVIPHMNLNDVEMTTVLRAIAEFAGINLIVSSDGRGSGLEGRTVTVFWEDVTVQAALDKLLESQGYGYIYQDGIVTVLPLDRLGEEGVRTDTKVIHLQYQDAVEMAEAVSELVKSGGGGGDGGGGSNSSVTAHEHANALIVKGTSKEIEEIEQVIESIDRRLPQILIDAKLIEMSVNYTQQIGVDFRYFNSNDPQNAFDVNLANGVLGDPRQAAQLTFGIIKNTHFFTGFIQAQASSNDINVLANPQILALDNAEARIEIVDRLPYIETNVSQGVVTESVQYEEAGIFLNVRPHVTEEGLVRMHVHPMQRIAGPNIVLQNSTAFPINVREAETDLIVPDGQTVVIGGLRSQDDSVTYQKVPFLGDVPILGMFFRNKFHERGGTDLLVFITPTIIKDTMPLTEKQDKDLQKFDKMELLKRREEQKKKWWNTWDQIGISS